MTDAPREPVFNKGPSGKAIGIIFIVAGALFLLGFVIDSAARSKDESIGAILPTILGLLLLVLDFILFMIWLARRRKSSPPEQ